MNPPFPDWQFPYCPAPPTWTLDWDGIAGAFEWIRAMEGCLQDPVWHAEGNVMIHTRMVCEALIEMPRWRELPPTERSIMFAATLMHDIAKPIVTRDEDGRIRSPKHAAKGQQMARRIILEGLLPSTAPVHLRLREQIVSLVRYHGLPLYLMNRSDPERDVISISQMARCDRLAMLAEADVAGRICDDQQELFVKVDLFREFSRDTGCFDGPCKFASDHSRVVYFEGRKGAPAVEVFDDTEFEVIVMSGLPGAGKDHWQQSEEVSCPIISLDEIRQRTKTAPEDNQGKVIMEARERARELMRRKSPFVWSATNTTRQMRRQLLQFFREYKAKTRIVYVEAEWQTLLKRNRLRCDPVPVRVIERLVDKLDVPNITEAHRVDWIVSS